MSIAYGQSIEWTSRNGSRTRLTVDGKDSPDEAMREVMEWAIADGWTPRRWWQWWRWGDPAAPRADHTR